MALRKSLKGFISRSFDDNVSPRVVMDDAGGVKQVNQYAVVRFLGKGSFAEVFLCQDKKSKRDVAVKVFQKSILRRKRRMARTAKGVVVSSELDKVQAEIAIMKKLEHPHLVRLWEVVDDVDNDQLFMFMEYIQNGPVMRCDTETRKFESSMPGGGLVPETIAAGYLLDVSSGLKFLHTHGIAHRDLKPDNILLGADGRCKIADFGVAHYFATEDMADLATAADGVAPRTVRNLERSHSRAQIKETEGTYCFWAPEMLEGKDAFNAYSCDMWALGICFYIFLVGELPFFDEAVHELFDLILAGNPTIPETVSGDATRLIVGMLNVDVDSRFTVTELETDSWLAPVLEQLKEDAASRSSMPPLSPGRSRRSFGFGSNVSDFISNFGDSIKKASRRGQGGTPNTSPRSPSPASPKLPALS